MTKKAKRKVNGVKPVRAAHRPSEYRADYCRLAFNFALLGATDKEIAASFDVSEQTLTSWKKKHPAFLASLKKGKRDADAHVAKCLYGRATGYDHPDVDIRVVEGRIVKTYLVKHHPPDVVAQIFWLKNRQPEKFRDKPQVEVTVNNEVTVDTTKQPEELTVPELRAKLAKMRATEIPVTNGRAV